CALGAATQGGASLRAATGIVDGRWGSAHGFARALLLLTLLCAGRAIERDARPLWRATAIAGLVAFLVCMFVSRTGLGLDVSLISSLDEPSLFGTSIVGFMMIARLTRHAWRLMRERPDEAGRWRAAAILFPLVAVFMLFG